MEMNGLEALGDENVVSFRSKKGEWWGSHGMMVSSVNLLVSGIKAEVFPLLFNRRLGPFGDDKIVLEQNLTRSYITGQEPMNR